MSIKAIETVYKGYRFRSRLEARWAVFFDALGIEWEYEAEGYKLDSEYYLPDFWLPTFSGGMFAEVKPDKGDFSKAAKLCEATKRPVWLCEGVPGIRAYNVYDYSPEYYEPENGAFDRVVGPHKGVVLNNGIPNADSARGENRMFWSPGYENEDGSINPQDYDMVGRLVIDAVEAARSARFEHGEQPITVKRVQPQPVAITPDWFGLEDYLIGLLYEASASLVEMDAYLVSRNQTPISIDDFEQPDNRALWLALQDCTEPTGSASERLTAIMGKLAMRPMALIRDMPREIALTLLRAREARFKNTLKLQEISLRSNPKNTEAALVVNAVIKDLETVRRCLSTTLRAR